MSHSVLFLVAGPLIGGALLRWAAWRLADWMLTPARDHDWPGEAIDPALADAIDRSMREAPLPEIAASHAEHWPHRDDDGSKAFL